MSELSDRVDTAIEELGEWMLEHPGDDPDEVIFEIAEKINNVILPKLFDRIISILNPE